MRRISLVVLCSIALAGVDSDPAPVLRPIERRYATVVGVVDGDTYDVEFRTVERIRLIDVDTFESRKVRRKGSTPDDVAAEIPRGVAAKKAVEERIKGQVVLVELEPPGNRDNFGRLLGKVYHDGESVGEWMKNKGWSREVKQ
jgi:endonuclease YncB( thermonuclease family)